MGIESKKSGGIGFMGLLALLFIALKLLGKIDWSWVWVLAPVWGPFAFMLVIVGVMLVLALIAAVLK